MFGGEVKFTILMSSLSARSLTGLTFLMPPLWSSKCFNMSGSKHTEWVFLIWSKVSIPLLIISLFSRVPSLMLSGLLLSFFLKVLRRIKPSFEFSSRFLEWLFRMNHGSCRHCSADRRSFGSFWIILLISCLTSSLMVLLKNIMSSIRDCPF